MKKVWVNAVLNTPAFDGAIIVSFYADPVTIQIDGIKLKCAVHPEFNHDMSQSVYCYVVTLLSAGATIGFSVADADDAVDDARHKIRKYRKKLNNIINKYKKF